MASRTMPPMPEIGTTRDIVPMAGMRIVIDGCGDLRLTTMGALEEELSVIDIREGGKSEISQHEVNLVTVSPVECERPMDREDPRVHDWWQNTKSGQSDHRNGTVYYVKAGEDVAKRELRDVIITKFNDAELDAANEDEPQKEKFTLKIKNLGPREKLT